MYLNIATWGKLLIFCGCLALLFHCSNPYKTGRGKGMAESVLDANESQLELGQAKITYLGSQLKPIPTVVFTAAGYPARMDRFLEVQRVHEPYPNDETPYTMQFSVEPSEFRRILSAVKPAVTRSSDKSSPGFLSFSVTYEVGNKIEGHEFRIGRATGSEFYEKLLGALGPADAEGRTVLMKQFQAVYPK
jgi:hypothetical protein